MRERKVFRGQGFYSLQDLGFVLIELSGLLVSHGFPALKADYHTHEA